MVIDGVRHPWQGVTKVANSTEVTFEITEVTTYFVTTEVNRTVRFSDRQQRCDTSCNHDRPVGIEIARCAFFSRN